ncbi:pyridoxamine 5'-phosphate oxidase family protein [Nocardioides sp. JQ2195]|uniref:pyridoxamine 5'-phosphate oxidase family protein n=1 Tax=Nocardioides sp. JQ2195 TaxID=2592334 RepID=UPI00143E4F33|nr:pyridoxamine 5'-phosphate oxidase family protein [Nocardioides sp. JQ2195]QIX26728.1 pyridoxamine 5'-phosphate oxidase family protein [Nocardioides sp. JQ2195]
MNPEEAWFPGRLLELTQHECLELLGGSRVGRVAYSTRTGPVVVPVNYHLDGTDVLLRTAPTTELAHHLGSSELALQVDEFDAFNESGWSVLVRGPAVRVDPYDLPAFLDAPRSWAGGSRPLLIRISGRAISGRRLLPV